MCVRKKKKKENPRWWKEIKFDIEWEIIKNSLRKSGKESKLKISASACWKIYQFDGISFEDDKSVNEKKTREIVSNDP